MAEVSVIVRHASKSAQTRVERRQEKLERARMEAIYAAIDPLIAQLAEALESKGEFRYEIPERQWELFGKGQQQCRTKGNAAVFEAECQKLGLKTEVQYHSETIEYRQYQSAYLVVTL